MADLRKTAKKNNDSPWRETQNNASDTWRRWSTVCDGGYEDRVFHDDLFWRPNANGGTKHAFNNDKETSNQCSFGELHLTTGDRRAMAHVPGVVKGRHWPLPLRFRAPPTSHPTHRELPSSLTGFPLGSSVEPNIKLLGWRFIFGRTRLILRGRTRRSSLRISLFSRLTSPANFYRGFSYVFIFFRLISSLALYPMPHTVFSWSNDDHVILHPV